MTPSNTIDAIAAAGAKPAIALKPGTPAEAVFPYINDLFMVLVMTVEPGFGGQSFMADMLPKIREIRKKAPDIRIQVDGGINAGTGRLCAEAGADVLVAGSYIFGAADRAAIGVYDLAEQKYYQEDLEGFMEIAGLSGSVTEMNGQPYIHLHAALADQRNIVHGGHVISLRVGATCEMFVRVLEGEVTREKDAGLGINLWKF